jgi:hypothetical protein
MPLLAHLKSNFKNNLAAIKMEDLFYHPAATQLTRPVYNQKYIFSFRKQCNRSD